MSPADLPPIWADAEELELAMLNLITNSLDAMPAGGSLTHPRDDVSRKASGSKSAIPGPASRTDLLPRIFQPWVTTKAAGRGTGLGLSITHDVIARHGGTISRRERAGTAHDFHYGAALSQAAERIDVQNSDS